MPTDPQSPDDCLSDEQYYAEEIDPIVQSSCVACHSEAGIASGTRMVLGDDVTSNYLSVSSMAAVIEDDRYMLLVKPTNQHPDGHGGGQPIAQGSDNYEKLELFVARVNEVVDDCAVDADLSEVSTDETCANEGEARRLLRRLSHVEYDNSIRDVFGLSGSWAVNFAADNVSHGYDNNAVALQVSPLLLDQYANAAEEIAAAVIANGIQAQVSCASSNRACARQFLEEKGTELFRRPLSESDIENHLEMYDLAAEDGFSEGMTWVITAMLQSPHFLYRSELGERHDDDSFALTSWEIASELSYLFWQTTPDSTLLELAAEDQLTDPEVIEAQVFQIIEVHHSGHRPRVVPTYADDEELLRSAPVACIVQH
ncbi:MAG: DUF1587 domain-containing protein, partial [Actinomycetota bacterium]|nr:DUF1587 domain-containing protein [Actinomycetota bacterium]